VSVRCCGRGDNAKELIQIEVNPSGWTGWSG
jgi:hypothetical protein